MQHPHAGTALKIGELAAASGVSVRAIRHYDAHGLLASARGGNGYRVFPQAATTQVRQIQRLIGAGFSLQEIRSFPDCMRLIEGAPGLPGNRAAAAPAAGHAGPADRRSGATTCAPAQHAG